MTLRSSKTYLGLRRWDSWTAAPPSLTGTGTSPVQPHPSLSPAWRTAAVGPVGASGQGDMFSHASGPVGLGWRSWNGARFGEPRKNSLRPGGREKGQSTHSPFLQNVWGRGLLKESLSKYLSHHATKIHYFRFAYLHRILPDPTL